MRRRTLALDACFTHTGDSPEMLQLGLCVVVFYLGDACAGGPFCALAPLRLPASCACRLALWQSAVRTSALWHCAQELHVAYHYARRLEGLPCGFREACRRLRILDTRLRAPFLAQWSCVMWMCGRWRPGVVAGRALRPPSVMRGKCAWLFVVAFGDGVSNSGGGHGVCTIVATSVPSFVGPH